MTAQTFSIKFEGYWREQKKSSIPAKSGIYCVYSCMHDAQAKTVSLKKLIYIGESENVNSRIANHEKLPDWQRHVKQGELLCYSFGSAPSSNRVRCEAATIFKHKPPVNSEYANAFPFDQTTMALTGVTALLHTTFTVNRT
jgi:excinuclease UvrABC nuclease subunit